MDNQDQIFKHLQSLDVIHVMQLQRNIYSNIKYFLSFEKTLGLYLAEILFA